MNKSTTFYELLYLIGLNFTLSHFTWWALIPLVLFFPKWGQIAQWVEVQLHKDPESEELIEEVENEIKKK